MSKPQKKRFLDVTYCGQQHGTPPVFLEPGWERISLDLGFPVDSAEQRLQKIKSQPSNALDAISIQQILQKIHLSEIIPMFREFRRILKVEGFMHVSVPDFVRVADYIKKDMVEDEIFSSPYGPVLPFDIVYGHREQVKKDGLNAVHQSGYTPSNLGRLFKDAGFYNIRIRREPVLLVAACHRPKDGYNTNNEKIRIIDPNHKNGQLDDLDTQPIQWKPLNLGLVDKPSGAKAG